MADLTEETKTLHFFDTNYLLNNYKRIKDYFYISQITLTELENIKTSRNKSDELKYKARGATRFLADNPELYQVILLNNTHLNLIAKNNLDTTSPDNIICLAAKLLKEEEESVLFYTEDLSCKLIAQNLFGLKVASLNKNEGIYKGYREIKGTTEELNNMKLWSDPASENWHTNEYLICTNVETGETNELRFDGEKFVSLQLPSSDVVKGKNSLQRCALDLLNNPSITVNAILGTYGSGKTFLSTKVGLHHINKKGTYNKLLAVRNPVGHGTSVGYLPGTFEEKTMDFFLPIAQQLDMGEAEFDKLKSDGKIDSAIPYYLKGQTFNSTFVLVDEVEDMNNKELKLIGTRLGEESKIVLCGDYKQSVIDSSSNNSVIDLCHQLKGNPLFGCICLEEDIRSETSKLFAGLWE